MSLDLTVTVSAIEEVQAPATHHVHNVFDEIGALFVPRLLGESNVDYRKRIHDTTVNRASSTYLGLVHGITRELGLDITNAIEVTASSSATAPVITVSGPTVYLYSDWFAGTLDLQIDRFEITEAYTVGELVDEINTSTYFTATLLDEDLRHTRAMTVLNQSSRDLAIVTLPVSKYIKLENTNLLTGTVFFSDKDTYRTLAASRTALGAAGDYYVDRTTGEVFSYSLPRERATIRYEFITNPVKLRASPVIIQDIALLEPKLFVQETDELGDTQNGSPTSFGARICNELYSVHGEYWGK